MLHWILDIATAIGYPAVFLGVMVESMGIPVPGETALLVGAVLAGSGRLNLAIVAVVGWSGAVIGDNIGYWVGRRWGPKLMAIPGLRRVYRPEHLEMAERFFARRGWAAVFFGRFVALLRILAGPLAGMHKMPWSHFLIANAAGGACWVAAVCLVGVLIGSNLDAAERFLSESGWIGLGLALVVGAGLIALAVWRHRRFEHPHPEKQKRPPEGGPSGD